MVSDGLAAGIVLTVLIVEASGFISRLINASPGIVLMIIGFWLTLKTSAEDKSKETKLINIATLLIDL